MFWQETIFLQKKTGRFFFKEQMTPFIFAVIKQIFSITTSLLSLSWGFVTWKKFILELNTKAKQLSVKNMAVDMIWNVLAISSRVLVLALFAGHEPIWFCGLVATQIFTITIMACCLTKKTAQNTEVLIIKCCCCSTTFDEAAFCCWRTLAVLASCFMVFHWFPAVQNIHFFLYLMYWLCMFVENIFLASLWFHWSTGLGLWYHEAAIAYIIEPMHCHSLST